MRDLSVALGDHFAVPFQEGFDEVGNEVLARGVDEQVLRNEIAKFLNERTPLPTSGNLASVSWSAVLSSCVDPQFDDEFRLASERRFMSHEVSVVTDFFKAIPPRTVPVFKLLGSVARRDSVLSTDSYSLKRGTWGQAVRGFTEVIRGASVLCLGMSECPWVLWDLLGMMAAQPISTLGSLVLLADDPLSKDQTLRRLLRDRTALVTVDTERRVLCANSRAC